MKILTIIGARPQIIKAAAISRAISKCRNIEEVILHTGQHYDSNMSSVFFNELAIPFPDVNLHIGSDTHGRQTARMIEGIEETLIGGNFDAIIVYGDTNSTLAGAVAASKLHIPIVHIEAGLRSFNMQMPEEQNRIVCDQLSQYLFTPTSTGLENLRKEGFLDITTKFSNGKSRLVENVGDIMYDNSMFFLGLAQKNINIIEELGLKKDTYVLATVHRDVNTDNEDRLFNIFNAMADISLKDEVDVVVPIHPRTSNVLKKYIGKSVAKNLGLDIDVNGKLKSSVLKFIDPVGYLEMILLEENSKLIITDSGGVQKEAYFYKRPAIILRSETEWVEIVNQGAAILTGAVKEKIVLAYDKLINNSVNFVPLFGDGHAAEKIIHLLQQKII